MTLVDPEVLADHVQRYQVSCIPSSVELILKHEHAVGR